MSTRIIGIDLAVTAAHQAAILDPATSQFVVKRMALRRLPDDLDRLLVRARRGAGDNPELIVVLEATAMAWHAVSVPLERHGVTVYRVNGRMTKRMRKVANPHARSDSIDCQVLARLYIAHPDRLDRLHLPTGKQMTLQRACREYDRLRQLMTAIDNRLTAYDNWAWQGLSPLVPAKALNWVRIHWYNPWNVVAAGPDKLTTVWCQASPGKDDDTDWIQPWVQRAATLIRLFEDPDVVDFPALAIFIQQELNLRALLAKQQKMLYEQQILPLFHQLYPDCPLTSIYGIGEASAVLYMAFIHSIDRFRNVDSFRQWTGMAPASDQSGNAQSKGLHITQAGPNLIKATLYLDANVARLWDPQLAQIYHKQMTVYGKHHTQAICAVASHLANRIYAVLKQNRPYLLRNLDGEPISPADAKRLIQERFHVPDEVRRRTNKRMRRTPRPAPAQ